MKKKDIIKLVQEIVQEVNSDAYGSATLTSQGQSIHRAPGVWEFKQPKSFDPNTINLVREMLKTADIHYNELVGEGGEISSFLDKRSGGTFFKFPHFNGPQGRGAMFGKETTSKINRSKSKSKSAALKTYTQFKTYIEDYEISDASPSGVYGNIYLFVMFNNSAEDYTAPKGGTQSSQFEENEKLNEHNQRAKELADSYSIKELQNRLDQIYREMEQEAEPEGGPIADMYADEIQSYEDAINMVKRNSVKPLTYGQATGQEPLPDGSYLDKEGNKTTVSPNKDTFTKSSKFDKLKEQTPPAKGGETPAKGGPAPPMDADARAEKKELENLEKEKFNIRIKYLNRKKAKASAQAAKQSSGAIKNIQKQVDQLIQQRSKVGTTPPASPQKENKIMKTNKLLSDYLKENKSNNLKSNLSEHKKLARRQMLMEGALKQFFEYFDEGQTDEEVVQLYAQKGVNVPETFVKKARSQYENLTKLKMELEMSEKEFKNSASNIVNNPVTGEADMLDDDKQLASAITSEEI